MPVGVHESPTGSYRPPVFVKPRSFEPPHTIISVPVHTAVWRDRTEGTLPPPEVGVQESVDGA